jgi:uncharacterized protein (TIGR02001 family)
MKKTRMVFIATIALVIICATRLQAQDQATISKFSVGADLYSNYVWRGTKFGQGPSVQPSLKFVSGGLTTGVWGSFDASGYAEADPYISYAFPVGLSLGLTDYYYPGLPFFEVSDTAGSHAFEINGGFAKGGFSLSANYIVNEAGGAASAGGDMYFQAGYTFKDFSLFAGAGNGWHTSDGEFAFCNLGIGATKTIKVTDSFSIPVNGQVILNPEREQLYIVVGFSF